MTWPPEYLNIDLSSFVSEPGMAIHELGTARMGNDPKKFVTNRFGQTHDVPNLYVADASLFVNVTDKPPAFSILTFSLRTSEHVVQAFRDELVRSRSRALAHKILASLKSIIGEAMRRGLVAQKHRIACHGRHQEARGAQARGRR